MSEPQIHFQVRPPQQLGDSRFISLLAYGRPGVGKTTFASTALEVPEMRSILFVSAESGELSIASKQDLDVVQVHKYSQVARIYEWMRLHVQLRDNPTPENVSRALVLEKRLKEQYHADAGIDQASIKEPTWYYTIVLDSLSEIQKLLMYQLLNIDLDTVRLDAEIEVAEQRDWLRDADMVRLLVRAFKHLPMNVIFIAGSSEPEGKVKDEINLPGKLSREVQGFVDMVGYFEAKKVAPEGKAGGNAAAAASRVTRRRLYLGTGYPLWDSKHRFEHLDVDYIDDPSIPKLLDLDRKERELASTSTTSSRGTPAGSSSGTRRSTRTTLRPAGQGSSPGTARPPDTASTGSRAGSRRRGPIRSRAG